MEKDSLALQALQEGKVDFADKRVQFKAAKVDLKMNKAGSKNREILEVDLGDLESLQSNEMHVNELLKKN